MRNIAIVLAGGIGARIGAEQPKQFIKVLGKPMMVYTLETFQKNKLIDEIILVCVESHIDLARKYCLEYELHKVTKCVAGGNDFVHSCINGMKAIEHECEPDDIVVITSADRPFMSEEEIEDSICVCKQYGSGIAARPCTLCMFNVPKGETCSTEYMREHLVQTATPWSFKFWGLMQALEKYENGELSDCEPYPTAIYAANGNRVYFSKSYPENIKITEKRDILLMECILREQKGER